MKVSHRLGAYDIQFLAITDIWRYIPEEIRIITDSNVELAWGHAIPAGTHVLAVPPGESSKSIDVYQNVLRWLYETKTDRKTTLIAFGGGVVGDLAGFAAATYMRGIPYVQVPTTLLAQVDSSVGGKVGVDLPEGKNLVGAFYPPTAVFVSLETLSTLPPREFRNGMAEVWKYGYALDASFLDLLRDEPFDAQSGGLGHVVEHCIRLKAELVQVDELDLSGRRAVLNFGHTVGHALERLGGYQNLLHGEAIAIGMVAEAAIGEHLGLTPAGLAASIAADLRGVGLPVAHALLRSPELVEAMRGDKKAEGGGLAFSLLEATGKCKLVRNVSADVAAAALSIV